MFKVYLKINILTNQPQHSAPSLHAQPILTYNEEYFRLGDNFFSYFIEKNYSVYGISHLWNIVKEINYDIVINEKRPKAAAMNRESQKT